MEITKEDRLKYIYYTDESIIGIKIIKSLTNYQLELLKGKWDGKNFNDLSKKIGENTNPNWIVARIAEELYGRRLIDEIEFDFYTR